MDRIRQFFERSVQMTDEDWRIFSSKLIREEFPKKHRILDEGQTENYLSFIQRGIIRFYIPREENDLTFAFAFDGQFVSAYDSFLTRQPSSYRVETLSSTVLWRLTYDDLQTIYRDSDIGQTIGRLSGEDLFLKKSERELSLLSETAEQRYLNLLTDQPDLIRNIPLKYIASYIGITPQALSRIRRRIY